MPTLTRFSPRSLDVTTPSGIRQADRPSILRDLRYAA
jgi:hypothetical protein